MSRIIQIAQHADDLDRASAFYEQLLGHPASAKYDPPGLLFFTLDGTRLLLEQSAPSAVIYLGVEDVRTKVEELRSLGIPIENEPHVIFSHEDDTLGPAGTDEWMAFIRDSEANLVGLVSHSPSAE
ncbi:MAG: Glyoxalase/bleomycin resistance protein/dioxygenase [Aeromicrobium sp.]|nr:Glyoxalase/bleomycin resistance protein/dioxygenase [Aeromicrobium sp.]